MFVDSHCHLNYKGLVETQQDVLHRARAAGVETMLNISTRASEWDEVIGVAEREPDVWASVGIHPHEADQHPDVQTATLVERAAHPRVVGIGESGLDTITTTAIGIASGQAFAPTWPPRAKPACRSLSTRATPKRIPRNFSPRRWGRGLIPG
jgi:Tat protein secretion system quality control protein TatD with DNase activity